MMNPLVCRQFALKKKIFQHYLHLMIYLIKNKGGATPALHPLKILEQPVSVPLPANQINSGLGGGNHTGKAI